MTRTATFRRPRSDARHTTKSRAAADSRSATTGKDRDTAVRRGPKEEGPPPDDTATTTNVAAPGPRTRPTIKAHGDPANEADLDRGRSSGPISCTTAPGCRPTTETGANTTATNRGPATTDIGPSTDLKGQPASTGHVPSSRQSGNIAYAASEVPNLTTMRLHRQGQLSTTTAEGRERLSHRTCRRTGGPGDHPPGAPSRSTPCTPPPRLDPGGAIDPPV